MQDFKKLRVWEMSHQLTLEVYRISHILPKEELYGLTSQIRRSATSIPMNIAEGCARGSDADFSRFIGIAFASASELQYQFILLRDLGYINSRNYMGIEEHIQVVKKALMSFMKKLKADSRQLTADS